MPALTITLFIDDDDDIDPRRVDPAELAADLLDQPREMSRRYENVPAFDITEAEWS